MCDTRDTRRRRWQRDCVPTETARNPNARSTSASIALDSVQRRLKVNLHHRTSSAPHRRRRRLRCRRRRHLAARLSACDRIQAFTPNVTRVRHTTPKTTTTTTAKTRTSTTMTTTTTTSTT